jgi:hypothetical protein
VEDPKSGTYILERTQGFFAGRSDEPCSGAARFEPCSGAARFGPADSGVAPLRSAASTAATRSPVCSRANPPTPATAGVGPWPPSVTRETWTSGAPPPRISNDCRCRGAAPDSTACGALDVDAESVKFPRDRRLCRESESGRSEPSYSLRTEAGRSSHLLRGSTWRGAVLCDSEAPVPPDATRGRTVRWSSWAGRAACRELETTFLSCMVIYGCRDDDTLVSQGGDDEDDPVMSLQSTATLATSPLHDGSGDGSSLEETPSSPAFRLLMRLSLRSRLAIWHFLCCVLRTARRLSVAALFRLKIASSGRGTLAGTR